MGKNQNQMESYCSHVRMSVQDYDKLTAKLRVLEENVRTLNKVIADRGVLTINRVIFRNEDRDDEVTYRCTGFDDVREEVEKHYAEKIEDLKNKTCEIEGAFINKSEELEKAYSRLHELKNRSLWQRILNR